MKEKNKSEEVKCIRRHLNNEYRRAIEVGEVITVKSDYAKYLKEIGVVECTGNEKKLIRCLYSAYKSISLLIGFVDMRKRYQTLKWRKLWKITR